MPLKYPLVHELVIVIADLYLPAAEAAAVAPELPGLERIARFGRRVALPQDWRAWLARLLDLGSLADEPSACVAARACAAPLTGAVWLATPVHYIASHAGVHLEQRGLLKLPGRERAALAADFASVFGDSGIQLVPLESGGFLINGAELPGADAHSIEPARCVGVPMDGTLPIDRALQRLRAEIEIWLFEHPVNRGRSSRGELSVTGLWTWGGGRLDRQRASEAAHSMTAGNRAYARDPYVNGLWGSAGARLVAAPPERLQELTEQGDARLIVVLELADFLSGAEAASPGDALGELDARWLCPAMRGLATGAWRRLMLVANDRCITVARYAALKRWRKARPGLTGLL
jgi:hypothetical protein